MPIKTDRELVVAYVEAGDESSFSELVVRHTQMVYRTCFRMLGNIHDTQDATQAVFIVLARKAGTLRREGNLGGWLNKVARNVALQALERRATSAKREKEVTMWQETVSDEAGLDSHADAALLFLDQELAGLSAVLRQAVVLRYLQGNSEKQAAELAACPQGTLSRRASDGIAKLRQRLAKRGVALSGVALASLLTSEASAAVPETLLPSILATVKTAVATTATATGLPGVALGAKTGATTTATMLAKGAMKAMYIARVKMVAAVVAVSVGAVGLLVPLGLAWAGEKSKDTGFPQAEVGAPKEAVPSVRGSVGRDMALAAGNNRLALDIYIKLCAKEEGNLFFSPYSIRTALAMTYAGARGETAAQMKKALHYTIDDATLHAAFAESIQTLNAGGQNNYELTVANSLWGEQTRQFLAPFVELTRTCYGGGLERVDFKTAAEPARLKINGWVEDRTKKKIQDLIPPGGVNADTRLVLVNAVYFKGLWAVRFDKQLTKDAPFGMGVYVKGGETTKVPLMHRLGTYRHANIHLVDDPTMETGPDAGMVQALELPYQGDIVSMIVLLPHVNTNLSDLENELTAEKLARVLGELRTQEVDVYLPRFKLTWGTKDLGPNGLAVLPALGMPLPFDKEQADFSGMDGRRLAGAGGLYIDAVFHKTFVDVYEEGTEAAAATAVVMKPGSARPPEAPPVFRADRPFLFLIREKATGSILFLGRVMNPVAP